MPKDTSITVSSGTLRNALSSSWRTAQETGGPLVVTVNATPEFAIYPLATEVPIVHRPTVMGMARRMYELAVPGYDPPAGFESEMPIVGPDMLRRSFGAERRRIRTMMTPFLFTHYHREVGVLFPLPSGQGHACIESLTKLWYPERYEQEAA